MIEDRVGEPRGRSVDITQPERQRGRKRETELRAGRSLGETTERSNVHVIGVPEGE